MKTMNILIAGVGGQGTLLASRILGALAGVLDCDVKVSEVHGMAQRGGSVVTYVRLGECIHSPLIEPGEAGYVLAFEPLEALRYAHMAEKDGVIITNTQTIAPMPVITGAQVYPDDILDRLAAREGKLVAVDALSLALEAGNARTVNTVLIGALAREMGLNKDRVLDILVDIVPPKTVEVNRQAFILGYNIKRGEGDES